MAKDLTKVIPALPTPTRGALVQAETDHTSMALLEFQSPTAALIGEPAPLFARLTTVILTTCVLTFILAGLFIKVDMVVTSNAVTVSRSPQSIIQPLETAVVRKVLVTSGQQVKKGELLAVLDPTFAGSDQTSTTAQMDSLKAQVARLRAELGNKEYVSDGTPYSDAQAQMWQNRHASFASQTDSLKAKMGAARFKVEQLRADEKGFAERLPLAQTVESKRRELARQGLDSQLNLLAAQDQRVQLESQLADTRQQMQAAQHELDGAIADLKAFVNQWFSDTSDTLATQERNLSDMTGQSTKNTLRAQLDELRSPVDGVVLSVSHISVGSVMQGGDELMRVVPSDTALDVEGTIVGSDAGYVAVGDRVSIKFDTLPYIIYGFAFGKVESVSPDSFSNLPPPQANPLPNQPSVGAQQAQNLPGVSSVNYVVRISIGELKLHDTPSTFKIVPGMPVAADIVVGHRSVFQYFFERLVPTFTEGLREPS